MKKLLDKIIQISRNAGEVILKVQSQNTGEINHKLKRDHSPVTEADKAAHDLISNALSRIDDTIPVLSEESEKKELILCQNPSNDYWLVDPLDGTKEFIRRGNDYTVNIALISGNKPILGTVYCPATQILYYAAKNKGAYKTDKAGKTKPIMTSMLPTDVIRILASRSHAGEKLSGFLNNCTRYELIQMGSSLKLCHIAEGAADIYPRLGTTSLWDTAAADCILTEAGGIIVDLKGEPLNYNYQNSLLNPNFLALCKTDFYSTCAAWIPNEFQE